MPWSPARTSRPTLTSVTLRVLGAWLTIDSAACTLSRSLGADRGDAAVPRIAADGGSSRMPADMQLDASAPVTSCGPSLPSQLFRRALCACGDVSLAGVFTTDSFDSNQGPFTGARQPSANAAIGCNAALKTVGALSVAGDVTVADPAGLRLPSLTMIRGTLRVNGPLTLGGTGEVLNSAQLAGGIDGSGALHIARELRLPPSAMIADSAFVVADGNTLREAPSISAPCACAPSALPDLATPIVSASSAHDNAAQTFNPARLSDMVGTQTVELHGRVYVTSLKVGTTTALTVVVRDKAALIIDGDLTVQGGLTVQPESSGELDVYVAGRITISSLAKFGSMDHPARVRVYVAGEQPVMLAGTTGLGANLYAPRAPVTLQGTHVIGGSVFAQSLVVNGDTSIHYDSASIAIDDACGNDACATCSECAASRACIAGVCTDCRSDADCCEPLVCDQSRCVLAPL